MYDNEITSRISDAGPAWDLRRRGLADSNRHDKRVKEAIRKNLRELIAEESIITSDGHRRIRIPIRYLEQYRFKYGQPQQGIGQGQGQPGDILGRRGGNGNGPGEGQPGDQPGEQTYEVNVPIEELTQMMLEDLALPWLEQKPERRVVSETLDFVDLRRKGSISNLAKRETLRANALRNAARKQPGIHDLNEADLRFRTWDINYHRQSNAAVYMLMDRSGSMTTSKKYIAKSFFFWMIRFLKIKYQHVDIVFIAHDTEANVVPEQDFFSLSNSGGTRCSSAYQVALDHILQFHPISRWNTYLFHFSDGDNLPYDNDVCKNIVIKLLTLCAMIGYGEIRYRDDASFYGWIEAGTSPYLSSLQNKLKEIIHPRLMIGTISNKTEVYGVLENFLGKPKIAT